MDIDTKSSRIEAGEHTADEKPATESNHRVNEPHEKEPHVRRNLPETWIWKEISCKYTLLPIAFCCLYYRFSFVSTDMVFGFLFIPLI